MANLKSIVTFLNKHLDQGKFSEDDSWNGLQVEGRKEVKRVAFAVTAGLDVFKKAKKGGADMIVAHHGIFWEKANPSVVGWYKKRISFLLDNNLSFYASHLPLDAHPEHGNNAQIIKLLEGDIKEGFVHSGKENIGWIGECKTTSLKEIVSKLEKKLKADCIVLNYGKKKIKRIAVVSGGSPLSVFEARNRGQVPFREIGDGSLLVGEFGPVQYYTGFHFFEK